MSCTTVAGGAMARTKLWTTGGRKKGRRSFFSSLISSSSVISPCTSVKLIPAGGPRSAGRGESERCLSSYRIAAMPVPLGVTTASHAPPKDYWHRYASGLRQG